MTRPDLGEDCALLEAAGREAADLALSFFRSDPREWNKADATVVSEADLAVDALLRDRLTAARPDYGWISEESPPEGGDRRRAFVVDPIDGTRGFLDGTDNWTISVAVTEHGRPLSAILVQPSRQRLFAAAAGAGAWLNDAPIHVAERSQLLGARLAGSRTFAKVARAHGAEDVRFIHSLALRIALVAAGEFDGAVTTKGANDWDLAAADLIVSEAGGRLVDLDKQILRYPTAGSDRLPVAASHPNLVDEIVEVLGEATRPRVSR